MMKKKKQAYWNVATKRLVDNVCMTMEQDFVVKLLGKVESELFLLTNRYTEVEELFVEVRFYMFTWFDWLVDSHEPSLGRF